MFSLNEYMSPQWLHTNGAGGEQAACNTDFETPGVTIPNEALKHWMNTGTRGGGGAGGGDVIIMLQCNEITNVSMRIADRAEMQYADQEEASAGGGGSVGGGGTSAVAKKRLLKLLLTDGHSRITAMEFRPCSALDNLLPGGKLKVKLLSNSNGGGGEPMIPSHRRDLLLLTPNRVQLCGGSVIRLQAMQDQSTKRLRAMLSGKEDHAAAAAAAVSVVNNAHQQRAPPPGPSAATSFQVQHQQQQQSPPQIPAGASSTSGGHQQYITQQAQQQSTAISRPPPPPPPPAANSNRGIKEEPMRLNTLSKIKEAHYKRFLRVGQEFTVDFGMTIVGGTDVSTVSSNESDPMNMAEYSATVELDDGQGTVLGGVPIAGAWIQTLLKEFPAQHWYHYMSHGRPDACPVMAYKDTVYKSSCLESVTFRYNGPLPASSAPPQQQQQQIGDYLTVISWKDPRQELLTTAATGTLQGEPEIDAASEAAGLLSLMMT